MVCRQSGRRSGLDISALGGSHILGGTSSSGRDSVTVRAATIAETQTLAAVADVSQSTVAQHQILSDQRLVAAAAILSAPTVTATIPSAVLTAQTLESAATISASTVVAPDPFAVISAQTVSAAARLVIPTISVQDAGTHVLIAETLAAAATPAQSTAVVQSPAAVALTTQTLAASATVSQPTLVAQAPTPVVIAAQAVAASVIAPEATVSQTISTGSQTVAAAATASQPTLVAQGPSAAVLLAQTVSSATALAQPAKVLTLGDFNDGGQLVDALALLSANLSQATRLYIAPERGGTDAPLDGELGIGGAGETLITRISWTGTAINLNDNDIPVALILRDWFGASNTTSQWTLTIQTDDGVVSSNQLGSTGLGFANFNFSGNPNIGIIRNIGAGRRFLFGLTRTVLASPNGRRQRNPQQPDRRCARRWIAGAVRSDGGRRCQPQPTDIGAAVPRPDGIGRGSHIPADAIPADADGYPRGPNAGSSGGIDCAHFAVRDPDGLGGCSDGRDGRSVEPADCGADTPDWQYPGPHIEGYRSTQHPDVGAAGPGGGGARIPSAHRCSRAPDPDVDAAADREHHVGGPNGGGVGCVACPNRTRHPSGRCGGGRPDGSRFRKSEPAHTNADHPDHHYPSGPDPGSLGTAQRTYLAPNSTGRFTGQPDGGRGGDSIPAYRHCL